MSKIFSKLYYHAVWATYRRGPSITPDIEAVLYPFLDNKAKRFQCKLHGLGGVANHIHVALSVPPSEPVSNIIGKLKGSSSCFLNRELQVTTNFQWQEGFGVLTFAEKDLPSVLRYIQDQKDHHRTNRLQQIMECVEEETDRSEIELG